MALTLRRSPAARQAPCIGSVVLVPFSTSIAQWPTPGVGHFTQALAPAAESHLALCKRTSTYFGHQGCQGVNPLAHAPPS